MAAMGRLNLRSRPEPDDVRIVRPMLENLVNELKPTDPIRFQQTGRKYVVDTTKFRNLIGFHYLQALLKQPGKDVAVTTLSPIGKQVTFEPVAEHGVVRNHINRKHALMKKLRWMRAQSDPDFERPRLSPESALDELFGDDFDEIFEDCSELPPGGRLYGEEAELEIAEELIQIEKLEAEQKRVEKFLSGATFNGKIKHIHNDYDRNRQTVSKCIRLAIQYLERHPDTSHIGKHLQANVKTGAQCRYSGDWNWIF